MPGPVRGEIVRRPAGGQDRRDRGEAGDLRGGVGARPGGHPQLERARPVGPRAARHGAVRPGAPGPDGGAPARRWLRRRAARRGGHRRVRDDRRGALPLGAHDRGQSSSCAGFCWTATPRSTRASAPPCSCSKDASRRPPCVSRASSSRAVGPATSWARWTSSWTTSPRRATGASRACTPRARSTRRTASDWRRRFTRSRARTSSSRSTRSPTCSAGVLVEVGDLLLDATTRGRLSALRDDVASGHLFRSTLSND